MLKYKKSIIASALALIICTSGCYGNISERSLTDITSASPESITETEKPKTTTKKPVITTVKITTTGTTTPETTEETTDTTIPIIEDYNSFIFSDEYNEFLSDCVFVGDSICSGLKLYEILPSKNVVAQGNVAARNIFDFSFKVGKEELSVLSALVNLKPKYVVFSMGMNDVNITSEKTFCENYAELLSLTEGFLPDAKLIVCAVTPISIDSKFTTNENIDSFNAALKESLDESEKWTYVDITRELKNSANALKTDYNGGDGVHLSPAAYYAMLYQVCERVVDGKVYDEEGNVTIVTTEETSAPETEAETSSTKKTKKTKKTTAEEEPEEAETTDENADTTLPPEEEAEENSSTSEASGEE